MSSEVVTTPLSLPTPPASPLLYVSAERCILEIQHDQRRKGLSENGPLPTLRCEDNVNQNGIKKNTENKYSGDYTFLYGKYNRFFQLTPKYFLIFLESIY